jgi:ferritin-like metal-binding protein YciE
MSTAEKTKEKTSAKSGAAKNLKELFLDSLKDIYWAEKALTKALPDMIKNASSEKLTEALDDHLSETENQIERLEEVFEMIGEKAEAKKCEAMSGIIEEGKEIVKETEPGKVRDAGIIAACQKVEHYEIATYGTLVSWSKSLKLDEVESVLNETLEEEKSADKKLAKIATAGINEKAKS